METRYDYLMYTFLFIVPLDFTEKYKLCRFPFNNFSWKVYKPLHPFLMTYVLSSPFEV